MRHVAYGGLQGFREKSVDDFDVIGKQHKMLPRATSKHPLHVKKVVVGLVRCLGPLANNLASDMKPFT